MSNRYKGAVISATPPTTSGGPSGTASGAWTLEQQMQLQAASLWPSQPPPNFIEDVFSCFLYTGTGATQTITNNIDLSTKGGLVWTKRRSSAQTHALMDTARGISSQLSSNSTDATFTNTGDFVSFNTTGYTIGPPTSGSAFNTNGETYVGWTFREQAKFFDIVTYTGTGSNTTIAHSLGSVPGSIIVKRTDTTAAWAVYHRSLANTQYLVLNTTAAAATGATWWNSTTPTSSVFSLGTDASVNASGGTYVAYIYAHDAGGFGTAGTDNVISCGSFTADGAGFASVTLGYEPQWILFKNTTFSGSFWTIQDVMRGMPDDRNVPDSKRLFPNSSNAESDYGAVSPTSTGFISGGHGSGDVIIYIAIRRGPMAVPTLGTSVFSPVTITATQATLTTTTPGFPPDLIINGVRSNANYGQQVTDRLRGVTKQVFTEYNSAEDTTNGTALVSLDMTGFTLGADTAGTGWNAYSGYTSIKWCFKRAPSFFDEVCYTGTGSATTFTHNLSVVPELMIVKNRGTAVAWKVYHSAIGNTNFLELNDTAGSTTASTIWNDTTPTSSVFTVGSGAGVNQSGVTQVAYLFATCAGVSKVGSYTGTGATQTINCGFTAGSRFVLIKRTDSTGDWYVWDSARGIVAGNDPYLRLNSAAAEVTGTDYIDTANSGFEISSTAPAAINANGGTYIFLAIA